MKSDKVWLFPILTALAVIAGYPVFAQAPDKTAIFNQSSPGVVKLVVFGENKKEIATGAAFAVGEDVLATSYHLISRAVDAEAVNVKGKKIKIEGVIASSRSQDFALLKIKGKLPVAFPSLSSSAAAGARIVVVGPDENGTVGAMEGTLSSSHEPVPGTVFLKIDVACPESYCGGPVLGADGALVGLLLIIEKRLKCAVPASVVIGLQGQGDRVQPFKNLQAVDYYETIEGASMTGRLAALLGESYIARMHLEKAVGKDPSLIELQALLADIYNEQRDYESAVKAYAKILEIDGGRLSARRSLAGVYLKMQRFADALPLLESVVAAAPEDKSVAYDLGRVYEESGDFAKAAVNYERFLEAKTGDVKDGNLRLGRCLVELKQYEKAAAAFEEALKADPQDSRVHYSLASAWMQAGNLDKAQASYQKLAEIDSANALSYYGRILQMYDNAGRYDKAVEAAKKIIAIEPKNELAAYNLGVMYQKMQRYDDAVAAFRSALAIKPDYAIALFNVGYSYWLAKNFKNAIEGFQEYIKIAPDDPSGWLNIGVGFIMLKNFKGALDPLKKAVELRPDDAKAQYHLGLVYVALRDPYKALEIHKILLGLDPALAAKLKKQLQ